MATFTPADFSTVPVTYYDCPPGQRKPPMLEPLALAPMPGTFFGMAITASPAQAERKPNCVICGSTDDARRMIAFLELDPELWVARSIGDAGTGRRYGKALVMWSGSASLLDFEQTASWISTVLKAGVDEVFVL